MRASVIACEHQPVGRLTGNERVRALLVQLHPDRASARVRLRLLAPYLSAFGVDAEVCDYPRARRDWRALLARAASADVCVLQKKLPSLVDGGWWRALGRHCPIVFDFDDAIMFRDRPRGSGGYASRSRRRKFARATGIASAFIAGNRYLAEFCPEAAATVVAPSAVPHDVVQWRGREPRSLGPIELGWIGSHKNLHELAAVGPAIRRVVDRAAKRERAVRLHVVSDQPFALEGVDVHNTRWSLGAQEGLVAGFDVALMPLGDNVWTRGKASYKLLQAMAAGVPGVASPVGMNREVVEHGVNGLLAADDDGWVAALERVIQAPEEAARLGSAGRQTVLDRFTFERVAETVAGHLVSAARSAI